MAVDNTMQWPDSWMRCSVFYRSRPLVARQFDLPPVHQRPRCWRWVNVNLSPNGERQSSGGNGRSSGANRRFQVWKPKQRLKEGQKLFRERRSQTRKALRQTRNRQSPTGERQSAARKGDSRLGNAGPRLGNALPWSGNASPNPENRGFYAKITQKPSFFGKMTIFWRKRLRGVPAASDIGGGTVK